MLDYLFQPLVKGIHPGRSCKFCSGISLEAAIHVVWIWEGALDELVEIVVRDGWGISFHHVLAGPVGVCREQDDSAGFVRRKTAEESQNKGDVGYVGDLHGLLEPVFGEFRVADEVPVVGVADNAGELGILPAGDVGRDGLGEVGD